MPSSVTVYENLAHFYGGMNGNILSSILGDRQYLKGINITCRGGVVRTRPGFELKDLVFNNATDEQIFEVGKWQGAEIYHSIDETYIVAAVSGNVFLIEPDTGRVGNVTSVTGRMNQYQNRLYFCQVERYMIVQDGTNTPIIIDGLVAAKSDTANNQVPVGTIMAYGHGRLFVKIFGNQFLAGDINQPTVPTAVLQFTETIYLSGGGAFGVPSELGEITGMAFAQNFDSSDGQGPLLVFCKNGVDTFAVYTPRSYWADNDISRVVIRGIGCASKDCIIITGDDLIFRTYEGIGSYDLFRTSDRRFTNMSQELLPFESQETEWLRCLSSGVLFDNRVLYTMVGEKVTAETLEGKEIDDYRFKALGVLDLAPLNGLSEIARDKLAVYDGAWTGPYPTQIIVGNFENRERCFVFGRTNSGANVLYELGKEPADDCGTRVNCRFYPKYARFWNFSTGGEPVEVTYSFKRLDKAALFVSSFQDAVNFKLWAKPDSRTDFTLLSEMEICAPMVSAEYPYVDITGGMPQARAKLTFPQFKTNLGDPVKGINVLNGYEFEFCIEWDGIAEIRRISLEATIQERAPDFTPDRCAILPNRIRDDFDYVTSCPRVRYLKPGKLFAKLIIKLGQFDSWSMSDIPGYWVLDPNGYIVDTGNPISGDTEVIIIEEPDEEDEWFPMPQIVLPNPSLPALSPPVSGPTIPTPPITFYPSSGSPVVNPGIGDTIVKKLPKPEDPFPYMVMQLSAWNHARTNLINSIGRGDEFSIRCEIFKYLKNSETGEILYQKWTQPKPNLYLTLGLGNVGATSNGDAIDPGGIQPTFDENGVAWFDAEITGGIQPVNVTEIVGRIANPLDAKAQDLYGECPISVTGDVSPNLSVAPMTLTLDVSAGTATGNVVLTNTVMGSYLDWTAELQSIDPSIVGLISINKSASVAPGLKGGMTDTIIVTCTQPASPGSYTATLHVVSGAQTFDVAITVAGTAPKYMGSVKMKITHNVVNEYHVLATRYAPPSGCTGAHWFGDSLTSPDSVQAQINEPDAIAHGHATYNPAFLTVWSGHVSDEWTGQGWNSNANNPTYYGLISITQRLSDGYPIGTMGPFTFIGYGQTHTVFVEFGPDVY